MTAEAPQRPHHHGNLREALVAAGLDILSEQGLSGLTLRACAMRAGVSHAAPAHHFDGLSGLLTAIAARGFDMFTASMNAERRCAETDPRSQVIAICHGYMRFAAAHPALFTLMFNTPARLTPDAAFAAAADAAYVVLAEACAPFRPVTDHPSSTEIMVWSLVHGLASLLQGGRFQRQGSDLPEPDIADILPPLLLRTPQ